MRYPASEKAEIIRLVEASHLSARRTLDKLGIPRATFYRWYDRYLTGGVEALADLVRNADQGSNHRVTALAHPARSNGISSGGHDGAERRGQVESILAGSNGDCLRRPRGLMGSLRASLQAPDERRPGSRHPERYRQNLYAS
jgi:hypothetical protein